MILYTVMPMEMMFEPAMSDFEKQSLIEVRGIPMLVEKIDGDNCRIVRMMSTDPFHFMNQDLQPGTVLKMSYFSQ
jgi:hypothetical protein